MKKVTAIIMAAEFVFAIGCCGTLRGAQKVDLQPVREIVSEHVATQVKEIKETTEKLSEKIETKKTTNKKIAKKIVSKIKSSDKVSDPYVKENLGVFSLTFYTPYEDEWGYTTATGVRSQHLKTCAVDPKVIPYGSVIRIVGDNNMVLELLACDCGGAIRGNKIDIFMDCSQKDGYNFMAKFGQVHSVYLLEE